MWYQAWLDCKNHNLGLCFYQILARPWRQWPTRWWQRPPRSVLGGPWHGKSWGFHFQPVTLGRKSGDGQPSQTEKLDLNQIDWKSRISSTKKPTKNMFGISHQEWRLNGDWNYKKISKGQTGGDLLIKRNMYFEQKKTWKLVQARKAVRSSAKIVNIIDKRGEGISS